MLEFLRALRATRGFEVRLPGLVLAFLIAEVFYKFHSFALECGAFLVTWLAIDIVVDRVAALLRGRPVSRR
ncbi:MAG: hypothetical protein ABI809_14520 [Caldimonas sp.]